MGQTVAFDLDGTLISSDSGEDWLEFLIEKGIATAEQARAECLMHMQNYSTLWISKLICLVGVKRLMV